MINWSDPEEVAKDYEVFERLIFILLGICIWEIFVTCDFEWSLITGRRKFKWPLSFILFSLQTGFHPHPIAFFFLSRYCIVLAIIGLIVSLSVSTQINCRALYGFNSWAGNMTILCSSTSLMLRTIALWERHRYVVVPLGVFCAGHWIFLYRTMFIVQADWSAEAETCIVVQASPTTLNATFFFTIVFDLCILVLTTLALTFKHTAHTDLWKLLFHDELAFFVVTFSANCIPAVLNVVNLNTPMNVIATVPAAVISSIASGRAVMRLLEFNYNANTTKNLFSSGPRGRIRCDCELAEGVLPLHPPEAHLRRGSGRRGGGGGKY